MARQGIPRVRHLHHRALERVKRQPLISDFVSERAATLTQYADEDAVWAQLHIDKAVTIAAEVDIP